MISSARLGLVSSLLALAACANDPLPPSSGASGAATTNALAAAPATAGSVAAAQTASGGSCGGSCGGACGHAAAAASDVTAEKSSFGAPLVESTPLVALADIVKAPAQWAGKRVRTRGEVVAVCQRAGCWADLKPEGDAKAVVPTHVSMHEHAFFLPKSVKSRTVEIEGLLATRALTKQECDHYNGEGASLTPGEPVVTIDALGVAVR